ncbi:uncharacterized protein [Emydura macquarii macquarii]|uniref:uncharacterized protein n=1 Tax=Emydura macquarii macquarii TaxID=1129001 RepID=UPI00352A7628
MAFPISVLVLSFLLEAFLSLGSGKNRLTISVAEGEPIFFECCFNGSPIAGDPFYEIIWKYEMTHNNLSKRILAFRMTRPNISDPVSITEGHFRGQIEFEKNTSTLFIPEVWVNDSGLYYCEVIIVPTNANLRTNETYLIVMAPVNVPLVSRLTAGLLVLFLLVLGLYFTLKHRIQAKKPEVSLDISDPTSSTPAPARRESFTQPAGNEIIYSKLQVVSFPRVSDSCGPVTEKPSAGTSGPGKDVVYAMLQAH